MKPVETIKFTKLKNPVDKLYREQKSKVANQQCRHLKGLKRITLLDDKNDEAIDELACSQCGHIMDALDMYKREKLLAKFAKLK